MEKIIVFSSRIDADHRFERAIGDVWNRFGFVEGQVNWVLFNNSYMDTDPPADFDLLLIYEPDTRQAYDQVLYGNILNTIADNFRGFIEVEDRLYVFSHNKTDDTCKELQRNFVQNLPGHDIPVDEYSHSPDDSRYQAVADVMEAGRDSNVRLEYQPRLDKLLATLSFPLLYDQAALIQMRLFLQYCQSQSDTDGANSVDMSDLPQSYQEFAAAAIIKSPELAEINVNDQKEVQVPASLHALCSNDLEQEARRENMKEFGQHLNKILLSVSGA